MTDFQACSEGYKPKSTVNKFLDFFSLEFQHLSFRPCVTGFIASGGALKKCYVSNTRDFVFSKTEDRIMINATVNIQETRGIYSAVFLKLGVLF